MNCNQITALLKNGNIPETNLEIYFSAIKCDDEIIPKTINTLNSYYLKASQEEKYLINNLLFVLECLVDKNKALKDFIIRTLDFNVYEAFLNKEAKKAIDFLLYENYDEQTTFEAIKETLKNPSFYQIKNIVGIIWANKKFYNNKNWLNLFDDMIESLYKLIEKEEIEKVMPLHFVIYHTYGNSIQTIDEWKVFNKKVEIPASKFYSKIGKKLNLPQPKKRISPKKKKIGIIFDRLVLNSPFMVVYSLIKNLAENEEFKKNHEIYIYSLNYIDKNPEETNIINALNPFVKKIFTHNHQNIYYNHLQKAIDIRNEIINDKIDYLITIASGYDINNFLITNRSAPKQIFWSHGNCAFDIPNIDKRISHFEQECKEFNWGIFNVPMAKEFLIGPEESKKRAKILKEALLKQFGKETIFLGTIGRLVKLESEEYLKVLSEIMKQNPNTIYLACGSGNQKKVEKLMQKAGINLKRVVFTGQVDPHMFGWVIDVFLNTFPLAQGVSKEEYYAKNNGIVIETKDFIYNKNSYFENLFKSYIPKIQTNPEYIQKIKQILKDSSLEKYYKLIQLILSNKEFYNLYKEILNLYWKDQRKLKEKQLNYFFKILEEN